MHTLNVVGLRGDLPAIIYRKNEGQEITEKS